MVGECRSQGPLSRSQQNPQCGPEQGKWRGAERANRPSDTNVMSLCWSTSRQNGIIKELERTTGELKNQPPRKGVRCLKCPRGVCGHDPLCGGILPRCTLHFQAQGVPPFGAETFDHLVDAGLDHRHVDAIILDGALKGEGVETIHERFGIPAISPPRQVQRKFGSVCMR
jgi:hypothetical protein